MNAGYLRDDHIDFVDLIRKKRDGQTLSAAEIGSMVGGVCDGSLPDYQLSAMLMAIYLRGLDDAELAALTAAMLNSGEVVDLSSIDRAKVDKHSTGGVGDKISLPLAAAVAACGVAVPMISGRGLGHTGGTLDKLEAIPGFSVDLSVADFVANVDRVGTCIIGQTERLAPADRRLYALRDVTATVASVPLIASSIMCKKLAEGIDGLVLDCKVGHGAFMKTREQARTLSRALLTIGRASGKKVTVFLTAMDEPIGTRIGNALEVIEAIEILRGEGPADTRELTMRLGAEMLVLGGVAATEEEAVTAIAGALDTGAALEVFRRMIAAQGGEPGVVDDVGKLPRAAHREPVVASRSGHVSAVAAADLGMAAMFLGAGRSRADDSIDHGVGIELAVRVGDRVEAGQELCALLHNGRGQELAHRRASEAFAITDERRPHQVTRILEVIR